MHWMDTMNTLERLHDECGDIISTPGGIHHIGVSIHIQLFPNGLPRINLEIPQCTHNIPRYTEHSQCTHDIPPSVLMIPSSVLNILQCTVHTPVYSRDIMQGGFVAM